MARGCIRVVYIEAPEALGASSPLPAVFKFSNVRETLRFGLEKGFLVSLVEASQIFRLFRGAEKQTENPGHILCPGHH